MPISPPLDPVNELIVLVRSRLYLVAIDTPDPARGYEAAALAASQLNIPIFVWTRTKGIRKRSEPVAIYGTTTFKDALTHIEQARTPAIWYFESPMDDGMLAARDIATVIDAKHEQLKSRGLLEFCTVDITLADVVGLSSLKEWLAMRRAVVADPVGAAAAGLPFPKGMLLVGVPGCGKSMCAKAVAADWGLPLLRMDTSGLFDKYVGESEKRFLAALDVAQRAAPCILWIDEIEKAFSSGDDSDGGVSLRVLGTFLSWLQDRKGDVFVVATANNIDRLPPEAVRKGRFDEIFFVDLPGLALREAIFRANVTKRAKTDNGFDFPTLAERADGFSGAEIEQAVVSAAYAAFARKQPLGQSGILAEIQRTVPLSRTMPDRVRDIRSWANGRAAAAGS